LASAPTPGPLVRSRAEIAVRVRELGAAITADYRGREPLLVTLLKGATIFLADLSRAIALPHAIDFIAISAYRGASAGAAGRIRLLKDLDLPLRERHVLVVEDVVDTGLTLNYLLKTLALREPASMEVCTLLDRPNRRLVDLPIRYRGFTAPDGFVVGYGFDHRERFRNLPDIHLLARDHLP
jgi:hypoxanthine phosphoribosyltransferase